MSTPFTSFTFPATGAPTARTMPNRLAEIKNVRDFGAVGDGVANDTAAIQATIDWQTANNYRGKIFFPPGTYLITATLQLPAIASEGNWILEGCGRGVTVLTANFNGYMFSRNASGSNAGPYAIRDMTLMNTHATGGAIDISYIANIECSSLFISAYHGITGRVGCFQPVIRNCIIFGTGASPPAVNGWGCCLVSTAFTLKGAGSRVRTMLYVAPLLETFWDVRLSKIH